MSSDSGNPNPAAAGDAVVSQQQFNQALAQVERMQRETMQNVHEMAEAIDVSPFLPSHPLSGAPPIPSPQFVPPSTVIPGLIQLAKPSVSTGAVKANVETWLFEVEQYLMAYGVDDDSQRIAFAAASLKGLALQWWQNHCILHPVNDYMGTI